MMLTSIKTNNSIHKWAEDLNRHSSKENIQMEKRHIRRCATLLIVREIQIKTMRYHLTQGRTPITNKPTNNKCWKGSGEKAILLYYWWKCQLRQPLGRTVWQFLKKLKIELPSCCSVANHIQLFSSPWTAAWHTSLSFTISQSLVKFMSIELVMLSNHLILCHNFLLWPSIFSSIRVFSNESALCIRWPKDWNFSFSISPSNEYSWLISFRID